MYYLYMLQCSDGSLYTGITNDIAKRFSEHKNKIGGRYTRSHEVKKILYTEKYRTKSGALKRELEIKSWRREKKLALINNPIKAPQQL
ncbi:MAG: GIY-YIG nuclease family protein [Patescibacteria group bacterium]|nr:GIY-YIG nuclease family protein [Patescibacteria group bacterium]MDE2015528.1 GIY-YIG nuclease family protein [Patescibacteria group bacterium]MDE2226856.1 GIY-YIG nuclease family protein [Patescibacteria group bacterium]